MTNDKKALRTGDYSIRGHETKFALERIANKDVYLSVGIGYLPFENGLGDITCPARKNFVDTDLREAVLEAGFRWANISGANLEGMIIDDGTYDKDNNLRTYVLL